mmetsp:Transcript_19336/g.47386  ORF Transcript_19336/g.47386 Transcript_19336/m.47386 type:complete len:715 (+) Transcript_19336:19-2163(+)
MSNQELMATPRVRIADSHDSFVSGARELAGATNIRRGRHPGWGEVVVYGERSFQERASPPHTKLGELYATALCGNDITGSCFYVIGSLVKVAGVWAPVGAIAASCTLWLYRWVYTEAVTALPFNGGIYNLLLNTVRSKKVAGLVATMTILSYIATCVVSATSAAAYLQAVVFPDGLSEQHATDFHMLVAIVLIVFFAVLKMCGMSESAKVAAGMFVFHLLTMAVLMITAVVAVTLPPELRGIPFETVAKNVRHNFEYTGNLDIWGRMLLGFSSAMLGVSGFETSANFVEEQADGVFPKTLRNMWIAVSLLNVGFTFVVLFATQLADLGKHSDHALAFLGSQVGGRWLEVWVCIDAFVVLAAAVLTSFVGISGLMTRMSGDRVVPEIFLKQDKVTTVAFGLICISLVLLLRADTTALEATYSFAFLAVMILFALSVFVLQTTRPLLPREMKNNPWIPTMAAALVAAALFDTVRHNLGIVPVFFCYLLVLAGCLVAYVLRIKLIRLVRKLAELVGLPSAVMRFLQRHIDAIQARSSVVYFAKTANICRLNKALMYVRDNEDTNHCRIVHVYRNEADIPKQLVHAVQILDCVYPSIRVDVVLVHGVFSSAVIQNLSEEFLIPPNQMFITCPTSEDHAKRLQNLCGVRVIMAHEEEMEHWPAEVETLGVPTADSVPLLGKGSSLTELLKEGRARSGSWHQTLSAPAVGLTEVLLESSV